MNDPIQLLLFPGFDELDAIAPLEILRAAGLGLRLVSAAGEAEITASHGLRVGVDGPLDPDAGGLLIVPGGGWVAGDGGVRVAVAEGRLAPRIAQAHAAGAVVGSVCTGGILLGAAGLLAGRPAITHAAGIEAIEQYGALVRPGARVVDDGDVITAGGVTSAIDFALHLVERLAGPEAAAAGATRLEYDWRPEVVVRAQGPLARP